jgi:hypothetical protein
MDTPGSKIAPWLEKSISSLAVSLFEILTLMVSIYLFLGLYKNMKKGFPTTTIAFHKTSPEPRLIYLNAQSGVR